MPQNRRNVTRIVHQTHVLVAVLVIFVLIIVVVVDEIRTTQAVVAEQGSVLVDYVDGRFETDAHRGRRLLLAADATNDGFVVLNLRRVE